MTKPEPSIQKPREFKTKDSYPGIGSIQMLYSDPDPQLGDLVMATAGEILHPAVHNRSIDASYIMLGVVKAFTYIKWVSEDGQDRYDNDTNNYERVVVTWAVIDSLLTGHRYIDANY